MCLVVHNVFKEHSSVKRYLNTAYVGCQKSWVILAWDKETSRYDG